MHTKIYIKRGTIGNAAPFRKIIKGFVTFTGKCHTENLQHSNLLQSQGSSIKKQSSHTPHFQKVLLECLTTVTKCVHPLGLS